jgi:hypothetical protein
MEEMTRVESVRRIDSAAVVRILETVVAGIQMELKWMHEDDH